MTEWSTRGTVGGSSFFRTFPWRKRTWNAHSARLKCQSHRFIWPEFRRLSAPRGAVWRPFGEQLVFWRLTKSHKQSFQSVILFNWHQSVADDKLCLHLSKSHRGDLVLSKVPPVGLDILKVTQLAANQRIVQSKRLNFSFKCETKAVINKEKWDVWLVFFFSYHPTHLIEKARQLVEQSQGVDPDDGFVDPTGPDVAGRW